MGGYAWVTLATNNSYSLGALVLAHSLKKANTAHKLAVLITPAVSDSMREQLQTVFDLVKVVDVLDSKDEAHLALMKRPDLGITFTKIHCWKLVEFEKCVFLDADTLVVRNCDELFEREEFSAAPDVSWPDCFNSGVFVYRPSVETFNKLLQFAVENRSFDGGDQGLLNQFFSDWATEDIKKHLPFVYNLTSIAAYSYIPAFKHYGSETRIVHFIGTGKPWLQQLDAATRTVTPTSGSEHLAPLLQQWWDLFCEKVHPNLDKNLESNNDGMPHPPVEACSNSLAIALTDERQTTRLTEPCTPYREKDDFRQYNLPYQPFDVKGSSGELLNVEFLLTSVARANEATDESRNDRESGNNQERREEHKVGEETDRKWEPEERRNEQMETNEPAPEERCIREVEKKTEEWEGEKEVEEEGKNQQEDPPPPKDPFDYNSFFPDETCINNYLEQNVVTYQPFESHQRDGSKGNCEREQEQEVPPLPRFLTIPENDRRQSGNTEAIVQEGEQLKSEPPKHPHPEQEQQTEIPRREPTPQKEEPAPQKEEPIPQREEPVMEVRELTKSKSMSCLQCDNPGAERPPPPSPQRSIWKSQPNVSLDPNRKYSMPKLRPILPKQNSFSKSVPSSMPKVTLYTEFLMSSEYKDPVDLPKDKVGFVESHIQKEAKLRRCKSDADIRSKFGPLPFALSPVVVKPAIPKKFPPRHLDNELYDLAQCKRQMGNKPKPKGAEGRKENIRPLPALKPIAPANERKTTLIKKRKSKELSPGEGGREKIPKREPKIARERRRESKATPRNVSTTANGNNLDEILRRLREFSKNYQHFFGVAAEPKEKTVKCKNAAVQVSEEDGGECGTSDAFETVRKFVGTRSRETQTLQEAKADVVEFRQFRNYIKDKRETNQKGLLGIQDILSDTDQRRSEGNSKLNNLIVRTEASSLQTIADIVPEHSRQEYVKCQSSFEVSRNVSISVQPTAKAESTADIPNVEEHKSVETEEDEKISSEQHSGPEDSRTCLQLNGEDSISSAVGKELAVESQEMSAEPVEREEVDSKHSSFPNSKDVNETPENCDESKDRLNSCEGDLNSEPNTSTRVENNSEEHPVNHGCDELPPEEQPQKNPEHDSSTGPKTSSDETQTEVADEPHSNESSSEVKGCAVESNVPSPAIVQNGHAAPPESKAADEKLPQQRKKETLANDVKEAKNPNEILCVPDFETPRSSRVTLPTAKTIVSEQSEETAATVTCGPDSEVNGFDDSPEGTVRFVGKIRSKRGSPPSSPNACTPPCGNPQSESVQDIKSGSGIAGAIAQLSLEAGATPESAAASAAHLEYLRRQNWETGNMDYMGRDSFDNIWSKICQTLEAKEAEEEAAKIEIPKGTTVKEKQPEAIPPAEDPVSLSTILQKCPEFIETLPGDQPTGPVDDDEIIFSKADNRQPCLTNIAEAEEFRAGNSEAAGKVQLSDILKSGTVVGGEQVTEQVKPLSDGKSPLGSDGPADVKPQVVGGILGQTVQPPVTPTGGEMAQTPATPTGEKTQLPTTATAEKVCSPAPPIAGGQTQPSIISTEGDKVKPPITPTTEAVKIPPTPTGDKVQPPSTPVGQQIQPPPTPVGQQIQPPSTPVGQQIQPPSTPVGQQIQPPSTPVGQQIQPPSTPVGQQMQPPSTPVGQQIQPPEPSEVQTVQSTSIAAEEKIQTTADTTPMEQKIQPTETPTGDQKQSQVIPAGGDKDQALLATTAQKIQPPATPAEEKTQIPASPAGEKAQPAPIPAETKPTEIPQAEKLQGTAVAIPSTPTSPPADSQQEAEKKSCTTVAIPSPPIVFPGAPFADKDKLSAKGKKPEDKPEVISEPIPLPPPESPTLASSQEPTAKTADSSKEEGKQKKGVFTKILEMVGVAPKEKNGSDASKSVFYDVEGGAEAKEIEQASEASGKQEGEAPEDNKTDQTEAPPSKEEMTITEGQTQETLPPEKKEGEQKSGQVSMAKPARNQQEEKKSAGSIQVASARRSPSPKLTMPTKSPETAITAPTPPPQPDIPPTQDSGLLKVDDTILETPPVAEVPVEAVRGKVDDIIGKAKSEVESLLQDAEKEGGESADLINTMKLMMGADQQEKAAPEEVEELKVTSEEERKRHKGEVVTSKLSDQILKAIPPPRRKAISEASASTSAIPKATPEQKTSQGEGKGKPSKPSSIPVPPPRSRGKPTQPSPPKGKGKK